MKHLLSSGDLEGGAANAQTAVTTQVAQAAQRRKCLESLLEADADILDDCAVEKETCI